MWKGPQHAAKSWFRKHRMRMHLVADDGYICLNLSGWTIDSSSALSLSPNHDKDASQPHVVTGQPFSGLLQEWLATLNVPVLILVDSKAPGVEVPDIENASSIDSQLRFLERKDLYSTEKPYSMRYRPKNGFSPSNLVFAAHDVTVRDMRQLLPALSLDVNGFEVHKMQTSLSRNDFDDYHTVHAGYIRKLEQYVKKIRGAAHVHALDYEVRTLFSMRTFAKF